MVVLVGCYLVVRQLRRGVQTLILFLISATALVAIGSLFADGLEDKLLHLLGKSSDLSGRTTIWAVSLLSIAKRPLLGYGFHGFWRENAEALTARAFIPNHWDAPHAHNGYIETLLELGIVGLVIVMGGFLLLLARGFRRYQATGDRADLWPVMLALMFFFYNISEAMGMAENTIGWILFTAAFFTAAAEQTPALVPWSAE
jgi:O-antigen ligase